MLIAFYKQMLLHLRLRAVACRSSGSIIPFLSPHQKTDLLRPSFIINCLVSEEGRGGRGEGRRGIHLYLSDFDEAFLQNPIIAEKKFEKLRFAYSPSVPENSNFINGAFFSTSSRMIIGATSLMRQLQRRVLLTAHTASTINRLDEKLVSRCMALVLFRESRKRHESTPEFDWPRNLFAYINRIDIKCI